MLKPNISPIYLLLYSRNPGAYHVTGTRPEAGTVRVNNPTYNGAVRLVRKIHTEQSPCGHPFKVPH